jgi:hypothetical protein
MLARVTDPAGKSVMIHKTYITAEGTKAPVNNVRMFCPGSVPAGSAVRLCVLFVDIRTGALRFIGAAGAVLLAPAAARMRSGNF